MTLRNVPAVTAGEMKRIERRMSLKVVIGDDGKDYLVDANGRNIPLSNVEVIEGPPGPPGKDGVDGEDSTIPGPPGPAGKDSTVPGPADQAITGGSTKSRTSASGRVVRGVSGSLLGLSSTWRFVPAGTLVTITVAGPTE